MLVTVRQNIPIVKRHNNIVIFRFINRENGFFSDYFTTEVIGPSNHGASCPPLNAFDLSSYTLENQRHRYGQNDVAAANFVRQLTFASGDQRFVAGPRPRTTRGGITAPQSFL